MLTWDPRANDLFLKALELQSASEREAYLDGACGGDAARRAEVEALLDASARAGSFLESPASGLRVTPDLPSDGEDSRTVIGPYKLIEQIGEGGMGTVWMAQQTEPVKRLVAVKLIKAGMDSKQLIARFEAERQALALMDHANIARVLDGGTTLAGRPYFVMDLVKGVPITRYCDEHHLTLRQRLELFIPVCQAVQHAHQKGIIHRDLKPSNVVVALYDGKPVPKVIDFGVAKAAGQSLTERTLVTGFGTVIGTPEYMSPEQAQLDNFDIDTRSDIYSLGVLLYELLTGGPPFSRKHLEQAGMLEMLRVIREKEPTKPSTKLSTAEGLPTLAANRGTEPARLKKLVRGELDWIVMKALEKDRNRRYETANGLGQDIERYLADEPVQACPPSAWYRLQKFSRRNKRSLLMAAVIGAAVLFVVGSFGLFARDRHTREQELARAREARQTKLTFEVEQALREAGALSERARSLMDNPHQWEATLGVASSVLKRAEGLASQDEAALATALQKRLHDQRTTLNADENDRRFVARFDEIRLEQTQMRLEMSEYKMEVGYTALKESFQTYYGIDFGATPSQQVMAVLRQRRSAIREKLLAALDYSLACAPGQEQQGRQWLIARLGTADPDPWRKQARQALGAKDWPAVEKLLQDPAAQRQLVTVRLRLALALPPESPIGLEVMRQIQQSHPGDYWVNHDLAGVLQYRQHPQWDEAIRYYTAALALRPRDPGIYCDLGNALWGKGDRDGALASYRRAIEIAPNYPGAHRSLGSKLRAMRDRDGADRAYRRSVEVAPDRSLALFQLGVTLAKDDHDVDGAIAANRKAIELNPRNVAALQNLGVLLRNQGKLDEAIAVFRQAIRLNPNDAFYHSNLGDALRMQGKLEEAIAECRQAVEYDPNSFLARINLGHALDRAGRSDEAIESYSKAIELKPEDQMVWLARANVYKRLGRLDRAVADFSEGIRLNPNSSYAQGERYQRIELYKKLKRWDEAIADYTWFLDRCPALAVSNHNGLAWLLATCPDPKFRNAARAVEHAKKAVELSPKTGYLWNTLGAAHYRAGDWTSAITALEKSMELKKGGDSSDWFFLAMAHVRQGEKGEAREWYNKAVRWMDKQHPKTEELRRFRAEAAELIGIVGVVEPVPPPRR
jgi:tetratricopeptide (TPR) repeat protein